MTNTNQTEQKKSWIDSYVGWFQRWMPDSIPVVFILTLVVAIIALVTVKVPIFNSTDLQTSIIDAWGKGFWGLLSFSMQMSLIMVSGYVVANAPVVRRGLTKLASVPNNQTQALLMSLVVGTILSWIHWGLGTMGGIVVGRQILAQSKVKGYKIHEPTFVGLIVCRSAFGSAGLSQSAPLWATTPGVLASYVPEQYHGMIDLIPMTETVLRPVMFLQIGILFVLAWFLIQFMLPKREEDIVEISDAFRDEILTAGQMEIPKRDSFAAWMAYSPILNIIIGGAGAFYIGRYLLQNGIIGLSIDNFNFLMIIAGILLCWTPARFAKNVQESMSSIWGVVIQFPFYAGIFGIIRYTGLSEVITHMFISISTEKTFPFVAFIYSAVVNIFVPSGGSKFAIEAPYIIPAALELGTPLWKVINAYVWGDLTTNIVQPFWLLPVISMYKTKFSKIVPYGIIFAVIALIVHSIVILTLY